MSDIPQNEGGSPILRNVLFMILGAFIVGVIFFGFHATARIDDLERKQATLEEKVTNDIKKSDLETRSSVQALASKVGMTSTELARRTAALKNDSKNLEKEMETKLAAQEEQTKQQIGAVTGEVTGVKGDVGKVKEDVSATRSDLDATKAKLERAVGDLTRTSELVATTHSQLEELKHRGDKNYYEFTLQKGKDPTRLSTVGLQLKKVDAKKNKFTLYIMADDRRIEKPDRTVNEPMQFYTGRDRNLFEVVVNTVDKNSVTGYLSTPKNMAAGLQSASKTN